MPLSHPLLQDRVAAAICLHGFPGTCPSPQPYLGGLRTLRAIWVLGSWLPRDDIQAGSEDQALRALTPRPGVCGGPGSTVPTPPAGLLPVSHFSLVAASYAHAHKGHPDGRAPWRATGESTVDFTTDARRCHVQTEEGQRAVTRPS